MLRTRSFAARSAKQDRDRARHEARACLPLAVPAPAPKAARRRMGRRVEPRRSERVRDAGHMARVRELPCAAGDLLGDEARCSGRIEADHAGLRAMGRKASDDSTIPMCSLHHRERHDFAGVFRDWSRAQMRAWLDAQIAWARKRLNHGAGEARQETAA